MTREITIVVHKHGDAQSRSVKLPVWFVRGAVFAAMAFVVLVAMAGVLYTPIVRTAARVPGLERDTQRLRSENALVLQLAQNLEAAEANYQQLRTMLGADVVPARERPGELPAVAYPIYAAPPFRDTVSETLGAPVRWPLDEPGIVTRGTVRRGDDGEEHAGLDVAIPVGTPIRAAGAGIVLEAGSHDEYGLFVRLRHANRYESMYGHASRLLVSTGDTVASGQVVALSGSTGRSTAPHLHYEIFQGGRSIDPRSLLNQESN
jgi:murein DD-endopeptidase MepM/ murein hydrolase activator NlpD